MSPAATYTKYIRPSLMHHRSAHNNYDRTVLFFRLYNEDESGKLKESSGSNGDKKLSRRIERTAIVVLPLYRNQSRWIASTRNLSTCSARVHVDAYTREYGIVERASYRRRKRKRENRSTKGWVGTILKPSTLAHTVQRAMWTRSYQLFFLTEASSLFPCFVG